MKKLFSYLLVVVLAFVLVGCNVGSKVSKTFKNDNSFFGFSAITSAQALSQQKASLLKASDSKELISLSKEKEEVDMEKVNEYMQMMEMMFSDDGPIIMSEDASDREGYETKLVFKAKDLAGNVINYTLYINKELIKSEVDFDDDDDDEKEVEMEEEYLLSGVAIIDGIEYSIEGKKEIEEDEMELEIKITLDDKNYVIISQEAEDNELEYEYEIVKDVKKYSKLEDGNKFECEFRTNENGYRETYHFEKENDKIKIKYTSNSIKLTIYVKATVNEAGETVYTYKVKETEKEYKYND